MSIHPELLDLSGDFGDFDGRTWLNCAHQGPLPAVAVEAARQAIAMKESPYRLSTSDPFNEVPSDLRKLLARLVGVAADDIILGNSASWGMSILANAIDWKEGDEVLLVEGDFPATSFAWLHLRDRGVAIRFLKPSGFRLEAADLEQQLGSRTRLVCTTWVHSLTGAAIDVPDCAAACRRRNALFVLNATQGVGARPFDAAASGVDAMTASGFKWQLGPYATGFCWIRPELRKRLRRTQAYWLANLTADDLKGEVPIRLRPDAGARQFDVFCPANFFNFMTWTASLRYLLEIGIERVEAHNRVLTNQLLTGIDRARFEPLSPESGEAQTAIVVLNVLQDSANRVFEHLRQAGFDIALRSGALRVAPHLYNTAGQIDRLIAALNGSVSPR